MTNLTLEEKKALIRMALEAREQAYVPYSDFMVGAALRAEDGRIFTGCNVENAAFTPTSCAERTALFKAVSEGVTRFTDIAVVGSRRGEVNKQITSPCGVCRQALFEFGGPELSIFVPLGIVLLVISYVVLYKTRFGLRLRACGEHPQAADSVGINVYKMRYAGVLLSGALGAIGGLAYIVPPVQTWNFEVGVAGAGFLALAVMIFGQWKPFNICAAAMFFAVFKSLANIADSTFLAQLHWSSNIYNMMPFIASMIILAFTSKNSMAPKAEGIPYDKGSR